MPATTIDTITHHAPLGYVREWELYKQFSEAFPEYDFPNDTIPLPNAIAESKDLP